MNYFNEMKNFLKDMTTDYYHLKAVEIETEELPAHYFNMGYILKQIEESTSMESILNDLRMGRYRDIEFFYSSPEKKEGLYNVNNIDQFLEDFMSHIESIRPNLKRN